MKKSTFRILKTIGIIAFILLFGVFVYLYYKAQFVVDRLGGMAITPCTDHGGGVQQMPKRPLGFDYPGRS